MSTQKWSLIHKMLYVVIFVLLMSVLVSCAAPAATPASEAAGEGEAGAGSTEIGFWTSGLSDQEKSVIESQIDMFTDNTGIKVELENIPYGDFLPKALAAFVVGEPPDVIGAWQSRFWELQHSLEDSFTPLDVDMTGFTDSGQWASSVDDEVYALPWSGYLCVPDFRLLGISQASEVKEEALQLITFLTEEQQQLDNFDNLERWYPTRAQLYWRIGCTDTGNVVRWPTDEQVQVISAAISADVSALERSLKGNGYWSEDQPTTFNLDWVTGKVGDEGEVQVGAVPVGANGSDFFLETNIINYFKESGGGYVVLGAVRIYDESVFNYEIPEGVYAAVWKFEDGSIDNDRFILVDQDGDEAYQGSFEDLNGAEVNEPDDPARQQLNPVVVMEEGSWWLSWLADSRRGRIP